MDFILRSDPRAGVLMVTLGRAVTDNIFLAGFAAVKDFMIRNGPHHGIVDFSRVERFRLSNEMLSELGRVPPAIPTQMRRVIVASEPAAYVSARIVQGLRADTAAPIEIVTTRDAAYAMLKTTDVDLIAVETTSERAL